MNYPLVRESIAPGVYFSSITDKKFKHNRMSVNLIVKLDRQKVTNRAVVPFILRQGSKSCPDFAVLNQRLCDLYGASLDAGIDKFGDYQIIALGIVGIDSRFALENEEMVQQCAALLAEILLDPDITDGKFNEKNTELEKQYLLDTIDAEINDKRTYATVRCKDVMCAEELCSIKKYGYREDAMKITPESAAKAYEELLRTARMEIMFEGCGDPTLAKDIFAQKFAGVKREPIVLSKSLVKAQRGAVKEETERMEVKQGKLVKNPCKVCHGSGKVAAKKTLEVSIPMGIDDDQSFALRGMGDAGTNGGPAGDVIVMVTVRPSEVFQRDENNIYVVFPITYSQAVLGDTITVPSIDGKVEVNVPEGTQSGTTFRLRGKGIQYLNGRGRGDMYVKCEVEIPKKLNKAQRDALKKFEGTLKEENYEKRKGFFKKLKDMFNA